MWVLGIQAQVLRLSWKALYRLCDLITPKTGDSRGKRCYFLVCCSWNKLQYINAYLYYIVLLHSILFYIFYYQLLSALPFQWKAYFSLNIHWMIYSTVLFSWATDVKAKIQKANRPEKRKWPSMWWSAQFTLLALTIRIKNKAHKDSCGNFLTDREHSKYKGCSCVTRAFDVSENLCIQDTACVYIWVHPCAPAQTLSYSPSWIVLFLPLNLPLSFFCVSELNSSLK